MKPATLGLGLGALALGYFAYKATSSQAAPAPATPPPATPPAPPAPRWMPRPTPAAMPVNALDRVYAQYANDIWLSAGVDIKDGMQKVMLITFAVLGPEGEETTATGALNVYVPAKKSGMVHVPSYVIDGVSYAPGMAYADGTPAYRDGVTEKFYVVDTIDEHVSPAPPPGSKMLVPETSVLRARISAGIPA